MGLFGLNHRLSPDWYLLVFAFLGVMSTIAVASVTYQLVEVPGQHLGRLLTHRLRNTNTQEVAPVSE